LLIDAFLPSVGLQLVGPYDVLAGKTKSGPVARPNYLRHWRYYYDPPEFLTIARGDDNKQFHIGYYRYTMAQIRVRSYLFLRRLTTSNVLMMQNKI